MRDSACNTLPDVTPSFLYTAQSGIHGVGVYTSRAFTAGEAISPLRSRFIYNAHVTRADNDPWPNLIGVAQNVWIEPRPPFELLNHSCSPNAGVGPRTMLIALRTICAGEEITIDYSTTECDPNWQMACQCHAPGCRQVLTPIQAAFLTTPQASPAMRRVWRQYHEATPRSDVPHLPNVPR